MLYRAGLPDSEEWGRKALYTYTLHTEGLQVTAHGNEAWGTGGCLAVSHSASRISGHVHQAQVRLWQKEGVKDKRPEELGWRPPLWYYLVLPSHMDGSSVTRRPEKTHRRSVCHTW
jgi:hypothetical protein